MSPPYPADRSEVKTLTVLIEFLGSGLGQCCIYYLVPHPMPELSLVCLLTVLVLRCWGFSPQPRTCQVSTLSLGRTPGITFFFKLETGSCQLVQAGFELVVFPLQILE